MSISRAEVEKVSLLARLVLSDDELDRMTSQMGDILGYVDLLSEVDTAQVEPMAHALDVANVFRDDVADRVWNGSRPWPMPRTATRNVTWFLPCWVRVIGCRRRPSPIGEWKGRVGSAAMSYRQP